LVDDKMTSDKYLKELLRDVVSQRAGGHCEFPGCNIQECDPHHWHSKSNHAILYDPDACINLCAGHHTGNTLSAHRSPFQFKKVIIENCVRSEDWADQVMIKAHQVVKDDKYFRETCKFKLLDELKKAAA
jgi:hypothetical protein